MTRLPGAFTVCRSTQLQTAAAAGISNAGADEALAWKLLGLRYWLLNAAERCSPVRPAWYTQASCHAQTQHACLVLRLQQVQTQEQVSILMVQ